MIDATADGDLTEIDLCVIGGGINGVGIARDAAGRGLSVLLCEKGDLGEGTSSRSSKLIHGGLRYLENLEVRLVHEALIEREVLLEAAPHIIRPMRFVMPQGSGDRPRWLVRLGLLLYDSHLVTRKFWTGEQAYLIQNDDRRVVFVSPYENDLALIGTTDVPFEGRPEDIAVDEHEVRYLLRALGRYFSASPAREDIVARFCGVRPLYDDAVENSSAVTRDYTFELDAPAGEAPMLSVFGGKITTFRKLAEHAMEKLAPYFPGLGRGWTAHAPLPGGEEIEGADFDGFLARLRAEHSWLPGPLAHRYARQYGSRVARLLDGVRSLGHLGRDFGGGLHEVEIRYLIANEWARTADDVLERRTKLGLRVDSASREKLEERMREAA